MKWYFFLPVVLVAAECEYIFDRYPTDSSWTHTLSQTGISIQLDDDSIWSVSLYDLPVAQQWHVNDSIAVTQNTRWFTEYPYRLVNRENGTTVEVDLTKNGSLTIVDTHPFTLSDGTKWQVESPNGQIGDSVTIGDNADSDPNWEQILILNKQYLKAKQL